MVSLAWLGGRWIPLDRMVEGAVQFGLGALAVVAMLLLLPRLFSLLERFTPAQPSTPPVPRPLPGALMVVERRSQQDSASQQDAAD
jgi:hypothetical protein